MKIKIGNDEYEVTCTINMGRVDMLKVDQVRALYAEDLDIFDQGINLNTDEANFLIEIAGLPSDDMWAVTGTSTTALRFAGFYPELPEHFH
jgi:hypothetical protein